MALPTVEITGGTLVADPELRYTKNGSAVCNFRVASNKKRKNEQDQWEDVATTFTSVVTWDNAETVASQLTKGTRVNVKGELTTRTYEKDGTTREAWEVKAFRGGISTPIQDRSGGGDQSSAQGGSTGWNSAPQSSFDGGDEPPF